MGKKIFQNILTFLAIFLVIQLIFNFFTNKKTEGGIKTGEIAIVTDKKEYGRGALVSAEIHNKTGKPVAVNLECPEEPLTISRFQNNEWIKITSSAKIKCPTDEKEKILTIEPEKSVIISYENWNHALFEKLGRYKIDAAIKTGEETKTITSNEFEIVQEGIFRFIWIRGFYQPIYNVLMFFVGILPGHHLWLAIALLTIFIRLILLIPSQKALHSQRRMQELQPKLNEIKEKYQGEQQKIGEETMKLWKENKVNPFGSCLPLVIQFPILIALFYVVQTGLNPDNEYLLYSGFVNVSFTDINVMFTKYLDLTKRNVFWLPLIVGLLQFLQMKMSLVKKAKDEKKSQTDMVSNTMVYFMPVMIALFTASVPAGVGLYWATSTIFGIAQQYFVNKSRTQNIEYKT